MTKPCKLTPIILALSQKEQFKINLDKFINNETISASSSPESFQKFSSSTTKIGRRFI